uniref:Bm1399, isoform b n=1 Tax=Brugia malayi TaxID=6279 RepID=A0A1I9G372_BRUMA|nr:Bm1399, isoform b [Brugia malayi]
MILHPKREKKKLQPYNILKRCDLIRVLKRLLWKCKPPYRSSMTFLNY